MLRTCFALVSIALAGCLSACGTKGPLYTPTAQIALPSSASGLIAEAASRTATDAA